MHDKMIIVRKKCGETPLECLNNIKKDHPEWVHLPLTYAGRLDPLAEGVLIVLIGDECLKKDEYLALSKEYEVTIMFGFSTDTYDLMGKVENSIQLGQEFKSSADFINIVKEKLNQFIGRITQKYPPYSSRTVNGKPLYQWAREGKIDEIEIPSHDVYVKDIELLDVGFVSGVELDKKINKVVSLVNGDFRQNEIINLWREKLEGKKDEQYVTIKIKVSCGSGVYVRSIAHELGKALGVPALAFEIIRTRVGDYKID